LQKIYIMFCHSNGHSALKLINNVLIADFDLLLVSNQAFKHFFVILKFMCA
jgi:hypothetical protein